MHPDHGVDVIGHVAAAFGKSTGLLIDFPLNACVNVVHLDGAFHDFVEIPIHHGKNIAERAAKAAHGIVERAGMLLDTGSDERVCRLQQRSPSAAQKGRGELADLPKHRTWTEDTGARINHLAFHMFQGLDKILFADGLA